MFCRFAFSFGLLLCSTRLFSLTIAELTEFLNDGILDSQFVLDDQVEIQEDYKNDKPAAQVWSRKAKYQNYEASSQSAKLEYSVSVNSDFYELDAEKKLTDVKLGSASYVSTLGFEFRELVGSDNLVGFVTYKEISNAGKEVDMTGVVFILESYFSDSPDGKKLHLKYSDPSGRPWTNTADLEIKKTYKATIDETLWLKDGLLMRNQSHIYEYSDGTSSSGSYDDSAT